MALVKRFDHEFPQKYFADFLVYVGMTEAEYRAVEDRWRNPDLFEKTADGWSLQHGVWV